MEKSADRIRKFRIGLLTLLLLALTGNLSLSAISAQYVQSLLLRKAQTYFFTNEECPFVAEIEGVSPDKVSVFVNDVPSNVSFIAYKKEAFIPGGNSAQTGTKIILTFRFEKPGTYQIKPVDVRTDGLYCRMNLESVYVYENPNFVKPEISLTFLSGQNFEGTKSIHAEQGKPLRFTIYVRYAVQVLHFSWEIPEDSIFTEETHYEAAEGKTQDMQFSPEKIPIATFSWIPLKPGTYSLPKISIEALSYSGVAKEAEGLDYEVTVLPSETSFASLPTSLPQIIPSIQGQKDADVSDEAVKSLYDASVKDLHLKKILWKGLAALFVLLVPTLAILIFLKKRAAPLCAGLTLIFLIASIWFYPEAFRRSAVFSSGQVHTIPELSSETLSSIKRGSLVLVKKKVSDWVLIQQDESFGWVKEDSLLLIK